MDLKLLVQHQLLLVHLPHLYHHFERNFRHNNGWVNWFARIFWDVLVEIEVGMCGNSLPINLFLFIFWLNLIEPSFCVFFERGRRCILQSIIKEWMVWIEENSFFLPKTESDIFPSVRIPEMPGTLETPIYRLNW